MKIKFTFWLLLAIASSNAALAQPKDPFVCNPPTGPFPATPMTDFWQIEAIAAASSLTENVDCLLRAQGFMLTGQMNTGPGPVFSYAFVDQTGAITSTTIVISILSNGSAQFVYSTPTISVFRQWYTDMANNDACPFVLYRSIPLQDTYVSKCPGGNPVTGLFINPAYTNTNNGMVYTLQTPPTWQLTIFANKLPGSPAPLSKFIPSRKP